MDSSEETWATDPSSDCREVASGSSGWAQEGRGGSGGDDVQNYSDEGWAVGEDSGDDCLWEDVNPERRRGIGFYRRGWRAPLYDGAGITVGEAVFTFLSKKVEDCEGDTACDKTYRLLHEVLLPKQNLFPPSLYMLRRLAGVEDLDNYERHVCPEDHYVWEYVPRVSWEQHYEDECPVCRGAGRSTPRFKRLSGGKRAPAKVGSRDSIKIVRCCGGHRHGFMWLRVGGGIGGNPASA